MSTWILLRGLTRESRHWGDFPDRLRSAIPGAEVLTLDLPGNGRFNHLASPTCVDAMAEFCRDRLRADGVPPPYHLLAMSLGAMVAVDWACRHPEEVRKCVLINTSSRRYSPFYRRLLPHNYTALLRLVVGGACEDTERTILRLTSRRCDDPVAVLAAWSAIRRERPVSRANALRQLLAAIRYRVPLEKPAVPVLVLASHHDALVDQSCSRRLAQHWQATLAMHPSAGHDLPLDDAAWVAEEVRRWLR